MGNIFSDKNSQMHIQEMIFMLIGFILLCVMVLLFVLTVSFQGVKTSYEESTRKGAIELIQGLAASPEFNCPDSTGICVDTDKVIALMSHTDYLKYWEVEGLRIERTYPYENRTVACSLANYPLCNLYNIVPVKSNSSVISDSIYVSLCRVDYKDSYSYTKCDLGKIVVSTKTS